MHQRFRDSQTVDLSRREEIPSRPRDVRIGREEIRRQTKAAVQRRLSLQTTERSNGAIVGGAGSTEKKLKKARLRRLALTALSEMREPEGEVRGGTEFLFQCKDRTYYQNF